MKYVIKILKFLFGSLVFAVTFSIGGYFVIRSNPPLKKQILSMPELSFLTDVLNNEIRLPQLQKTQPTSRARLPAMPRKTKKKEVYKNPITLYLVNGGIISGDLLRETKNQYVVRWEGGEISFAAREVSRVERGQVIDGGIQAEFEEAKKKPWNYQQDVVLQLTNGEVLDAAIKSATKNKIVAIQQLEGGGKIEQEIDRAKLEYLMFRPVGNDESRKIEAALKKQFPQMKFYTEGNVTIITDSYITWVKEYRSILRRTYTDIYLNFIDLFRNRKPGVQNFVVIFDDHIRFIDYAVADGVPGWAVLGYFNPKDKILYLFNSLGDRFSDYIDEAITGRTGRAIDRAAGKVKQRVDKKFEAIVDGRANDIKNKYWRYHDLMRANFRERTTSTLRHEFAHEIFHNWGLQNVVVSKIEGNRDELIAKKKEFVDSKDAAQKRKLLQRLMALRSDEKPLDIQAANSWLTEGIATYCETDPMGGENERWLFLFQEMVRKDAVYPLEQLMVYRIGSFPGVYPEAMLYAYSESWALTTFLMSRYPEKFMEYQKKISENKLKENEDILWFEEIFGKKTRELEQEFLEFMKQFPQLEDPFIKQMNQTREIFNRV